MLRLHRFIASAALAVLSLTLPALHAAEGGAAAASPAAPPAASPAVSPADLRWLARVAYGPDAASVNALAQLGRAGYLAQQLSPGSDAAMPAAVNNAIAAMPASRTPLQQQLTEVREQNQRINAISDETEKQARRQQRQKDANQARQEAVQRHLLRAVYSPWQLQAQMDWFWLNHFSVFADKGNLRWLVADYDERAIRPHALGRFGDLLRAVLEHPAMLEYLDNAQSAVGKINENLARELLELHTVGVNSGYTQGDVQELARVLTGLGISYTGNTPRVKREWQDQVVLRDGFEFNPARHDWGTKTVLGQRIEGRGLAEIDQVVEMLALNPATAKRISRKIAVYFVADEPPQPLVDRMAARWMQTGGDIAEVLRTMFTSPEFDASLTAQTAQDGKLKDPMQFVISSLRLAYRSEPAEIGAPEAVIGNLRPVVGWLNALGQPLFGRVTPDGWPLDSSAWASPGQLVKRFEIARAIGSSNAGLFAAEDGKPADAVAFPQPGTRLYWNRIEPVLTANTRQALQRATSQAEWNTLLLAAPEWMQK